MDPDNPHLAASQLESQYLPHPSRPKTHPPTGSGPGQFRRSLSQDVTRNQGKHRRKQSSEDLCDIPKQPPKDRGAGRGPRGEVARVQTSGLCASRARERGLAGGQPQAPGAPGAGPHPAWSTRGHSEPSTGHTRFLCSSTAPANPGAQAPTGGAGHGPGNPRTETPVRPRSPAKLPRPLPQVPGGAATCQEPLDKQGALPSLARSRLRHPAGPLRMPPSRLPRGHFLRPPPMTGASSPQPRKSTRQSTHVEEIGLVPLAEEPLCRHVLQLLPRDTTA